MLLQLDLNELFKMESSALALILRGTLLYLGILFLMRILPRRIGGEMATMDLIFILLVTEAASHSLGDYTSLSEGFIMIGTMILWNYLVNALSCYFPFIEKLVSHPPVPVIKNGQMQLKNMRREFLTKEELMGHLRDQGIEDVSEVKKACIESDGSVSVVKKMNED